MPSLSIRGSAPTLLAHVRHADMVFVDHLPALPAGEEQDEDSEQREPEANARGGSGSILIAKIKIDELDDHGGHVSAGVQPGIVEITNLNVAHHINETGDGGECGKDECNAEEPLAHSIPEFFAT